MNYRHACKAYEKLLQFVIIILVFITSIAVVSQGVDACCNDNECPYHQACSGALCPLWGGTCLNCCDFWIAPAGGPIIKCCDGVVCPLGNQYVCDSPHCFTTDCTKVHPETQCGGYWCVSACPGGGSIQCNNDPVSGWVVNPPKCLGTSGYCDTNCVYHPCVCIGTIPNCSDATGCFCGYCQYSSQCSAGYCCDKEIGATNGMCRYIGYINPPYVCA